MDFWFQTDVIEYHLLLLVCVWEGCIEIKKVLLLHFKGISSERVIKFFCFNVLLLLFSTSKNVHYVLLIADRSTELLLFFYIQFTSLEMKSKEHTYKY